MRKKNVFTELALYMIGFGIVIGTAFPFFALLTGVPAAYVMRPFFFVMCIGAGCIVGLFNIFLARRIVGDKMRTLSHHMKYVADRLTNKSLSHEMEQCTDEQCFVKVDSSDAIGESAESFNTLVHSLAKAFKMEKSASSFAGLLASRLELEGLAEEALNSLMENLAADAGALVIEKEGQLLLLSSTGIKNPKALLDSDMLWKVFKEEKRLLLDLPEDILLDAALVEFKPKSILIEPIIYKDSVLGAVILAGVNAFSQETVQLMGLYNHGLALALRNAVTHDQLQTLAANDPLTGIFNRRFGLTRLKDEFSRAIRNNQHVGVLMFDIDHFKAVNDTYGHLVGDKVLINITQIAKNALREGDVFLRYGGEEFLVVLPGASRSDMVSIGEKLRRLIEDSETRHKEQVIKVTISIGGTSFPERTAENINDLIGIADKKLYQAKDSGRNMSIIE